MSFEFEHETSFSADHPSFAGHFPANPVVAGVLILDQVRMALQQWRPDVLIVALPQVKFAAPLLPQQRMVIRLDEQNDKCRFRCERDGELLAHGELRLKPSS
jgi:3-hydroxymyristoyl/3-hydroxydecanoyl-(acyl carrier protein) dehydratase